MLRDFLATAVLLGCAVALLCASQQLETVLVTPNATATTIAAR